MRKVTVYKCDVCGGLGTMAQIRSCQAAHTQAKEKALIKILDAPRLEATSPEEAVRLIEKYAREFKGAEVELTEWPTTFCTDISDYVHGPVGSSRSTAVKHYAGFRGRWRGSVRKEGAKRYGIHNVIGSGCSEERAFRGFHTGTGEGSSEDFSYDGYMFLSDFPKIQERYNEYVSLSLDKQYYDEEKGRRLRSVEDKVEKSVLEDPRLRVAIRLRNEACEAVAKREGEVRIKTSKAIEHELEVPTKFNYDEERFTELDSIFQKVCRGHC